MSLGELVAAREHTAQGSALYRLQEHRSHVFLYGGHDPGVCCLGSDALALWHLGYADLALQRSHEALTLAQDLSHPFSLTFALISVALLHQLRRETQAARERAEATITLSTEHGFPLWLAQGTVSRGWALAEQGHGEEGIAQIRQGLNAYRATGAEVMRPYFLALLAEAYEKAGQAEEGLNALAEALAVVNKTGGRYYEAELYRIKGQLVLQSEVRSPKSQKENQKAKISNPQSPIPSPQHLTPSAQAEVEREAGACFLKAIEISRSRRNHWNCGQR
jgi:predicted ATPase